MITVRLNKNICVPVFKAVNGMNVMIDTSARIPVFTRSDEVFRALFPDAEQKPDWILHTRTLDSSDILSPTMQIPKLQLQENWLIHNIPVTLIEDPKAMVDFVLPWKCAYRFRCILTEGIQPTFNTDLEDAYATPHFDGCNQLMEVVVHTLDEEVAIRHGKKTIAKYAKGDPTVVTATVSKLCESVPTGMKLEHRLSDIEAACMYCETSQLR